MGGVSKNTSVVPAPGSRVNAKINEVFARLESWHLILRSDQKGSSALASHAYLPKRYLFDTGVLRELRESAVPAISAVYTIAPAARTPLGAIIENQTAIELARGGQPLAGWKRAPAGSYGTRYSQLSGAELSGLGKCLYMRRCGVVEYVGHQRGNSGLVANRWKLSGRAPDEAQALQGGQRDLHLPRVRVRIEAWFAVAAGALEPIEQHRLAGAAVPCQGDVVWRSPVAEQVRQAPCQHRLLPLASGEGRRRGAVAGSVPGLLAAKLTAGASLSILADVVMMTNKEDR